MTALLCPYRPEKRGRTVERTQPINGVFTPAMLPHDYPHFTGEQLCAQIDPEWMFPSTREHAKAQKNLCRGCVFMQPCGEYALHHPEEEGVWGAMTEIDRRKLRSRLGIAS